MNYSQKLTDQLNICADDTECDGCIVLRRCIRWWDNKAVVPHDMSWDAYRIFVRDFREIKKAKVDGRVTKEVRFV